MLPFPLRVPRFRQIGFDRKGRPVIYSCIKQEVNKPKVQPEDANL